MTDLLLHLTDTGADFQLEDGDFVADEGLETAVVVSLFSDARAELGELLPEEIDQVDDPGYIREVRGFWADTPGDRWGSKLWLLGRSKATPETASRAARYAEEALAWMVTNGIATAVTAAAEFLDVLADDGRRDKVLSLTLGITRGASSRWSSLWDAVEERSFEAAGVRVRMLVG